MTTSVRPHTRAAHHVDCTCGCRQRADRMALQLLLADREAAPASPAPAGTRLTPREKLACRLIGLALAAPVIALLEIYDLARPLLAWIKALATW